MSRIRAVSSPAEEAGEDADGAADERRDRRRAEADEQRDLRAGDEEHDHARAPPSVPSGNSRLGGSNTSPTFAFGSPPMSSGPASARKTNTPRTKTATIADLLRRTGPRSHATSASGSGGRLLDGWRTRLNGAHPVTPCPRIELEVQEIGEQVEEDHRQREEEERRLQHRVVALVDRLDDEETDPGYEKTYSTVIAPPMMKPSDRATSVTGSIAFRKACFQTVDQFERPFARDVRM